jgi:hypothetical protein
LGLNGWSEFWSLGVVGWRLRLTLVRSLSTRLPVSVILTPFVLLPSLLLLSLLTSLFSTLLLLSPNPLLVLKLPSAILFGLTLSFFFKTLLLLKENKGKI